MLECVGGGSSYDVLATSGGMVGCNQAGKQFTRYPGPEVYAAVPENCNDVKATLLHWKGIVVYLDAGDKLSFACRTLSNLQPTN